MRQKYSDSIVRLTRFSLIALVAIILVIAGIIMVMFFRNPKMYSDFETFSLGTYVHLKISTKANPSIIAREIFAEMDRITDKFNPYKEGSVLYNLNHSNDWFEVDDETFALIDLALRYAKISEGTFDPALGRLISLWGFSDFTEKKAEGTDFLIPDEEELEKALGMSGYKKIELDYNRRAVKTNGAWIDLGGIAKGYALERAYQIAKSADPKTTGFIEAGGDIRILGPKFGNDYWIIGIRNPRGDANESIDYIYVKSGAIATSGDYERFFIKDGVRYHHIINPKSGKPAKYAISATVISDDAIKADAFSTAAFVLGTKDWIFTRTVFPKNNTEVFLVAPNKAIYKTDGFERYEKVY
ncbi:FAD:protein FMN transferase [Thermosipho ferrireducens]|uniref:FAD:protein FMN transferase n=1 Tax=Thermosipho ferrireducens TaxID=2571116 RepID=A0ABX7S5Z7_9BACT|nr:FAD:protein FMN transferase [Thermosipho ferrireducens]QTA37236.1 FAD:protein FMN transferase [Thermosipho ferrireducens]